MDVSIASFGRVEIANIKTSEFIIYLFINRLVSFRSRVELYFKCT